MKTLADLKRSMIIGSKWEAVHYDGWTPGIREIVQVKTTQVGFETVRDCGKIVTSWVDFPKAKDILFSGEWVEFWGNWFSYEKQETVYVPIMKYRLIEA